MSGRHVRKTLEGPSHGRPAVSGRVEFLNPPASGAACVDSAEPLVRSTRHRTLSMAAALATASLVGVMTFQAGTDESLLSMPPPTPPLTVGTTMVTVAPSPEVPRLGDGSGGPADADRVTRRPGHDPYVLGVPGRGQPFGPALADHALLYVNSSGRATVLDLSTGDREEIEIAEERSSDVFLLEFGHVVTRSWGSTDQTSQGERSIAVGLDRTVEGRDALTIETRSDVDVRLCLDAGGCTSSSTTAAAPRLGVDSVEAIGIPPSGSRSDALADFLGVSVVEEGRWLVTEDFRLPAPLDTTPIWLVHQPVSVEAR